MCDNLDFRIILTIVAIKINNLKMCDGYGECDFLLYSVQDHAVVL